MRATAVASAGSSAARSRASWRSAAITQSCSYRSTVKPAAASSSESSPKPAVASIAHGLSMPFVRAAFTSSSCCRRPCLSRGSMRVKIGTQLHRAVGEREALGRPGQLKPRGPSNRKGIDDAHGHSLTSKTNTRAPFMPAPNRPLLSHMRHGPQHPNAKHRHQSRAHGSDHRITHAPSQRPRLIALALLRTSWLLLETSSLPWTSSSQRRT